MPRDDFVGTWQYLGTLTPVFNTWQRFPISTNSFNPLIRLTYYGELNKVTSRGYLRAVFSTPESVYGRWVRFYPKAEKEVINYPVPPELLFTSDTVTRHFEVCKRNKGYPSYYRTRDTVWSVAVENLEVVSLNTEQQAILAETEQITMSAELIKGLLGGGEQSS